MLWPAIPVDRRPFISGRLSWNTWTTLRTSTWLKNGWKTSEQAEAAPTLSRKWSGNLVWRIEFDEAAKKELARLDRQVQVQIQRFLRERIATEEDPRRFGESLRGNLSGFWKYRVGDYRIVAEIREEDVLVLVVRIGHRSKVYGGH